MFVLQCRIKSGFMTNSLLAMHPAVQHMVLHLMNINAVKWEWSLGTGLMAGKLPHMILLFRKFSFICFSSTPFSHWGLVFCLRNLKHAFKSWKCLPFGSMIPVLPGPNTMLFLPTNWFLLRILFICMLPTQVCPLSQVIHSQLDQMFHFYTYTVSVSSNSATGSYGFNLCSTHL